LGNQAVRIFKVSEDPGRGRADLHTGRQIPGIRGIEVLRGCFPEEVISHQDIDGFAQDLLARLLPGLDPPFELLEDDLGALAVLEIPL